MIRKFKFTYIIFILCISFSIPTISANSNNGVLEKGVQGDEVSQLQTDLKRLGFFTLEPTGYFGDITEEAVIKFQKQYKLEQDGKVGSITYSKIDSLLKKKNSTKIVIDPGHGGIDPGTDLGKDKESNITLAISKLLQSYLIDNYYTVVMTRTTDTSLDKLSSIKGTFELKDLNARTNIINNSRAKLFVSIHVDSAPDYPNLSGSIVYYNYKIAGAKTLAQNIQKELNSIIVNNKKRVGNECQQADFYILKNANVPGVLVETAFVTNKQERELLMTDSFRSKLAKAIMNGIEKTLED